MAESASVKRRPCAEHAGPRELPRSEFNKQRDKADGLNSWCRVCVNRRNRARGADPDVAAKRAREHRRYRDRLRDQVFGHYGRVCACPWCGAPDNLTIDHVNGGGTAHRIELFGRSRGSSSIRFYRWLIAQGFPDGYQALCPHVITRMNS